MSLLSQGEIEKKLKELPGWSQSANALRKEFEFPTFADAMIFVNEIAQAADDMSHHPEMTIRYNKVMIISTTHDAGGITEKDLELVKKVQEAEKSAFGDMERA